MTEQNLIAEREEQSKVHPERVLPIRVKNGSNYLCNVQKLDFSVKGDSRGFLIPFEKGCNVPFDIKRFYYIYGSASDQKRGFHAHKKLKQLLIAVSGSVRICCEWNEKKENFILNSPNKGLLIEGMVWHVMDEFSKDCVLAVLASAPYDEADYVRDYNEFLREMNDGKKSA